MSRKAKGIAPSTTQWTPRKRPLIVLADQGEARSVAPDFLGPIPSRDQSWNTRADQFISVNRPNLAALEIAPELTPTSNEITLRLRPGGVVGAVPLYAPDSHKLAGGVVVRPRFGWDDIGPLLSKIGWSAAPDVLALSLVPGSAREVPPWVLAGPLLHRLARLIREVRRGFRMHEEIRQWPRGQILWHEYATRLATRGAFHLLPCRYPELGPDLLLRGWLRWGVEQVRYSLAPFALSDVVAKRLIQESDTLLFELRDTPRLVPERRALDGLLRHEGLPTEILRQGLQALGWISDERGLAGQTANDGLAWRLPMHVLFERWVEHCVRFWASGFGGAVRAARTYETTVPIAWSQRTVSSLGSLAPDIVVQHQDHTLIFDAKYKGHFEELDDHRWAEVREDLRESHRHDLHQVLAYAALYNSPRVTAVLVYPMQPATWVRLAERGQTLACADLIHHGRNLAVALCALPLRFLAPLTDQDVTATLAPLMRERS